LERIYKQVATWYRLQNVLRKTERVFLQTPSYPEIEKVLSTTNNTLTVNKLTVSITNSFHLKRH